MVSVSRNLKGLIYLISPSKIYPNFYIDLNKVLASKKVSFFQLRLKNKSLSEVVKVAKNIKVITQKYNVKLIINDSSVVAKKINADGCHLGQKDEPIELARKNIKNKIIGVTCHGSKELALQAYKKNVTILLLALFLNQS
jgi:thiamine-phosphate pyrophosphorylase